MGATNIEMTVKGKATKKEIENAFSEQVKRDRAYNGHQDGYSGDFQTVDGVNYDHLGKVFANYNEAEEFCLDKAQKWEDVIAVYYTDAKGEVQTLIAGWGAC